MRVAATACEVNPPRAPAPTPPPAVPLARGHRAEARRSSPDLVEETLRAPPARRGERARVRRPRPFVPRRAPPAPGIAPSERETRTVEAADHPGGRRVLQGHGVLRRLPGRVLGRVAARAALGAYVLVLLSGRACAAGEREYTNVDQNQGARRGGDRGSRYTRHGYMSSAEYAPTHGFFARTVASRVSSTRRIDGSGS